MSSAIRTSLAASAASAAPLSPDSQCQMWLFCLSSPRSGRRTGAPGSSAWCGSMTTGSGSYSTSTAATPSAAAERDVATTAATSWLWYITVSVGSTICLSPARVGIQWSPAFSRSAPVITAATPGTLSASVVSMPTIFAWAYGLRTMSSQSWPGRLTSSMYSPLPRMKRGSSLRLTEWPMPPISAGVCRISVISRLRADGLGRAGGRRGHCPQLAGRLLDRLHDVHVAGAAAEVAADPVADLLLRRVRVLAEQPGRLHDHPGGAEAALEAVLVPESLLERMERGPVGHPLDRPDLGAVRLDREHRARLGAPAIDVDGARAAVARVAADVRAGQPERVAEQVDEEEAGLDVGLALLPVDGEGDVGSRH